MRAAGEEQLLQQAKERDPLAFRRLVESYMKRVYNIAHGIVHNHADAEDVAQEAFVRVYRSLATFRGESEFNTWLYRITVNLSLDRFNQNKRRKHVELRNGEGDDTAPANMPVSHQNSDHVDVKMHVERALHELPTLQRAVVLLRHMNGLSTKTVSEILQCSEGTVKTHLHRGLKKMRVRLEFMKADL